MGGAVIETHCMVTATTQRADGTWDVVTDKGTIHAEHVVNAAFWNMGENCSAASRLIVHKDVKAPLLERIVARCRDWKTGDPLDPGTHIGALIDAEHCEKVRGFLDKKDRGPYKAMLAKIMLRHQEPNGCWWDYTLYNYHQQYGTGFALQTLYRCLPEKSGEKSSNGDDLKSKKASQEKNSCKR